MLLDRGALRLQLVGQHIGLVQRGLQHRHVERLLGPDVVQDIGGSGDVAYRDPVKATLGKQLPRPGEDDLRRFTG